MLKRINITTAQRELLSQFFKKNSGLELRADTWRILEEAILERMNKLKIINLDEYIDFLKSTHKPIFKKVSEFVELLNLVTIKETYFFRTLPHFSILKDKILPQLFKSKKLVIWSAGCSIGCEPYSIAICVLESLPINVKVEILATDISTDALEYAKVGVFTKRIVKNVEKNILDKYFIERNGKYEVIPKLKNMINFYHHNLITDIYPQNIDIIFCRNVVIYFDRETTNEIVNKFYNCLNEGGFLIIGHSESLYGMDTNFELVDMGEGFVYRKPKRVIKFPISEFKKIKEKEKLKDEILEKLSYLYNKRNYDEAITYALNSIKEDRSFAEVYTLLGKIFLDKGSYEEATKYLRDGISINPLDKEAHFLLAMAYYKLQNKMEAIKEFKKTIYLEPDFPLVHFNLANIYNELGMKRLAVKEYKITIELLKDKRETKLSEFMEGITEETIQEVCQMHIEKLKNRETKKP